MKGKARIVCIAAFAVIAVSFFVIRSRVIRKQNELVEKAEQYTRTVVQQGEELADRAKDALEEGANVLEELTEPTPRPQTDHAEAPVSGGGEQQPVIRSTGTSDIPSGKYYDGVTGMDMSIRVTKDREDRQQIPKTPVESTSGSLESYSPKKSEVKEATVSVEVDKIAAGRIAGKKKNDGFSASYNVPYEGDYSFTVSLESKKGKEKKNGLTIWITDSSGNPVIINGLQNAKDAADHYIADDENSSFTVKLNAGTYTFHVSVGATVNKGCKAVFSGQCTVWNPLIKTVSVDRDEHIEVRASKGNPVCGNDSLSSEWLYLPEGKYDIMASQESDSIQVRTFPADVDMDLETTDRVEHQFSFAEETLQCHITTPVLGYYRVSSDRDAKIMIDGNAENVISLEAGESKFVLWDENAKYELTWELENGATGSAVLTIEVPEEAWGIHSNIELTDSFRYVGEKLLYVVKVPIECKYEYATSSEEIRVSLYQGTPHNDVIPGSDGVFTKNLQKDVNYYVCVELAGGTPGDFILVLTPKLAE